MQQLLQSYLHRLTNLSGNNRSLLLLRLISDQFIDIHGFNFLNNEPSFSIVEKVIAQKPSIQLLDVVDSRNAESNKLANRLKKIQRIEKFIFDETGSRDLYVGWPFIRGKFNEGTMVRAPLLFFPVSLHLKDNEWYMELRTEVNIGLNKSFLLAYSHYNKVSLEESLVERVFDDFDTDSRIFRTALYELLKDSAIELHFNQDLFADQLSPFENFTKKEFEKTGDHGQLKLYPEAVIGIFPQAGSYLAPDYEAMIEKEGLGSLDDFFLQRSNTQEDLLENHSLDFSHFLTKVKEEETFTPYRMDAFQENAIKATKKGNSLVVQGPPGTGKSQLICNLIGDYIARGKKVLVVCQKRAALDVVYQRLDEHNITDFVGLVHDFKNDRKEIYKKVASQVDRLNEYQRSNNSLDTIQLERSFQQSSRLIDQVTEELEEYKKALFDESECGLSAKELYLTSDPGQECIPLTQEYHHFHFHELSTFVKQLTRYLTYARNFNASTYPWADRVNFALFRLNDLQKIQQYLHEIPIEADQLTRDVSSIVEEQVDFDVCRTISENLDKLKELARLLKTEEIFGYFREMIPYRNEETELLWLNNTRHLIHKFFDEAGVETSIAPHEIGEIQKILQKRANSKKGILKSLKWRFSKEKYRLARVMVANQLQNNKEGIRLLTKRLDNRLNLQHQITKLLSAPWVTAFPESLDYQDIDLWFDKMETAIKAKLLFMGFANFKEYFSLQQFSAKTFRATLKTLADRLKELPKKRVKWNAYILPKQIDLLLASETFLEVLKKSIKQDFDAICEMDKLKQGFNEAGRQVVEKLEEKLPGAENAAFLKVFDNSLRLAWIDHIERKYPVLRTVSTQKFDQMVNDLQHAVQEKLETSNQMLLQKVREKTYGPVSYNRLNNRVTYRDLYHQVTKKRRVWPIRRLISHFSDELFCLIPCWMASPESVSAIFPLETLFDLVIFDEASQCFAEKGIPAIYRGKQIVVTGDSKQLKPNDLYHAKWETDEENPALEMESLLDLARHHLMQVHLRGHYRSQSLDLINFSNQYFYQNKLQLLPHANHLNKNEPGIEYYKVDGIWEKQANLIEAEKVVELVSKYLKTVPEKTLGIVTFNATQQGLIIDLLEDKGVRVPDMLFVKNIENVQGDERDIIIFSMAYAPDKNGKLSIQFGSLNLSGGENRLNVAITRAREKIMIVSSIWPEALDVSKSKNEGPKLLKYYLEYARDVWQKKLIPQTDLTQSHHHDWYLKTRFKPWGKEFTYHLVEELPFADLTAKKKEKYYGLLLTDDDLYHESISAKDTFVYKPFMLTHKNWKFKYFHSREYWQDDERVKENLGRFLEAEG